MTANYTSSQKVGDLPGGPERPLGVQPNLVEHGVKQDMNLEHSETVREDVSKLCRALSERPAGGW